MAHWVPPSAGEEGVTEIRKDWELFLLRRKYAEITGPSRASNPDWVCMMR